ncbi:AEC family transporter [Paenibacillus alkalitolerans]|uniref:AEC family transporter n=1 Tax=Paenibacillus alkalitolerans TaxID=2799335 RepID=UPI0018F6EE72|nr:AEC family transporter [Paenibacillus alkalitolerans]
MSYFLHILLYNVIPLSIMISVGAVLQRAFKLDIRTLSKLNFYLFSPAILFVMLYESTFTVTVLLEVLLFFVLFYAALIAVVEAVMRLRGFQGGMRGAMRNSVIFYNSANFAIPLNQLVFANNPFTLSVQLIIMVIQSVIPNTFGIYSVNAHRMELRQILRTILTFPVIYIVPLAFLFKFAQIPVPESVYIPLEYISQGFIATALVTLGAQLGNMKWSISMSDVLLSNALRLLVSPAIGFGIVLLLGYHGPLAQALVLSCAVPTSLSSVLLAVEFENEPDFASQAVFSSTLFSIVTVTFVIAFIGGL